MDGRQKTHELPAWLWLWGVLLLLIGIYAVRWYSPVFFERHMASEQGPIENIVVVFLVPAIVLSILLVKNRGFLPNRKLAIWYGLMGIASLFFAGEEISWGQHWFGWETPEEIAALNDQEETNLHNMSSWLDQKPRLIVELGAVIGGVLYPLYRYFRRQEFASGSWQYYFWPTWVCFPVCLIIGVIKIPDRLFGGQNIPFPFDTRVSEIQEVYVALAFMIYLLSVWVRIRKERTAGLQP